MPEAPRLRYIPALDGLRAVAIGAVIFYHGGFSWMPGGALGVDLFFVLSGFLITTLLLRELDQTGGIALRDFYVRRVRRLFPALLLLLFAIAAYAATTPPQMRAAGLWGDSLASLFYVANWHYIWADRSYFASFGAPSPLLHVWSLAVEEQWYVFWPPALLVMWRLLRRSRALLVGVLVALSAGSALWMRHLASGAADPSRAYYGTDTRAHTLLVGATLAVLLHGRTVSRNLGRVLQTVGAVGLLACIWFFGRFDSDAPVLFRGGFLAFAILAAASIAGVMGGSGPLNRLLALRPLVYLGRISYSLYLWHWLFDVWLVPPRINLSTWPLFLLRTGLALAVSALSYAVIERPLRSTFWERFSRPRFATLSGASAAAVVALLAIWPGAARKVPPPPAGAVVPATLAAGEAPLRVAVLGGSDAWALAQPSRHLSNARLFNGGALGCGLVPGEIMVGQRHVLEEGSPPCATQDQRWSELLTNNDVDVVVITFGAWEVFDHWQDGEVIPVGSDRYRDLIQSSLSHIRSLIRAKTTAPIVFLDTPCMDESKVTLGSGRANPRNDPTRVAWVNDVLHGWVTAQTDDVAEVRWSAWLCPDGKFLRESNGVAMRPDGVHLAGDSAVLAWNWLEPQLRTLADSSETS